MEAGKQDQYISHKFKAVSVDDFSKIYPFINKFLMEHGEDEQSRNGNTKEVLNFKTEITNPYQRISGCLERDINIFFLIAEAMWIFSGKGDVEYLKQFNSKIADYSDDGVNFHAPYGWRLRKYGITTQKIEDGNKHILNESIDQIQYAVKMLSEDSSDRRVVLSIWNPELDLGVKSKDLPCNDLLMLKVRKGKLHATISNRSNDLHWGLPTNIFQFSFLTEIISLCLGIELGTQTHNSQSLHFYLENNICWDLYTNLTLKNNVVDSLYDETEFKKIDYQFSSSVPTTRLTEISNTIKAIVDGQIFSDYLLSKSTVLCFYKLLLDSYLKYKESNKTDEDKLEAIHWIIQKYNELFFDNPLKNDVCVMALNFFASKMKNQTLVPAEFLTLRIGKY